MLSQSRAFMVCSQGESLTHRTYQMKPINAIAAAALAGVTLIAAVPASQAQSGLYSPQYGQGRPRGNGYDFGEGGYYEKQRGTMYRYGNESGFGTPCKESRNGFGTTTYYGC